MSAGTRRAVRPEGSGVVLTAAGTTYALSPLPGIRVLSVCTDARHPGLINYRLALDRLGYDYRVLGLGERWGGWRWRTARYIAALEAMEERVVVLTDCTDVLFVEPPDVLEGRFRRMGVGVLVGGERGLSTGKYRYDLALRKATRERYNARESRPYRFPNGGLIVGYRTPLLELLYLNRDAEDDQAGLAAIHDAVPGTFSIDADARLFGNLVQRAPFFDEDVELHEMSRWRLHYSPLYPPEYAYESGRGIRTGTATSGGTDTLVVPSTDRMYPRLMNLDTGTIPCVLHFAGGNWTAYNVMGKLVLGPIHQEIHPAGKEIVTQMVKRPWSSTMLWALGKR
jgi:hypothetical protein